VKHNDPLKLLATATLVLLAVSNVPAQDGGFPFVLPKQKPNGQLSKAMERNYTAYMAPRPENNELYSLFKYTELKGLDYHNHDGTITRRDPSKVIFANGKYYVWYTYRNTPTAPQGAEKCTDMIPSRGWSACRASPLLTIRWDHSKNTR
jgi:hypothetical protein